MPALDESAAWRLVRAVEPGRAAPLQVHDSGLGVRLQVYPSGAWSAPVGLTEEARQVLDLYLPLQLRSDLVVAQAGQSLDGRIATTTGHSHYVTGPEDIRRLHRLRALVDAVIVGAGTVDADDPRLTVREVAGDNPVRVVMDPHDRLERSRRIFCDGAAPTVVIRRRPDAGPAPPGPGRDAGRTRRGRTAQRDRHRPAGGPVRGHRPARRARGAPRARASTVPRRGGAASPSRDSWTPARSIGCTSPSRPW